MSLETPDTRGLAIAVTRREGPADSNGETNISPGLSGVDGRTASDKMDVLVT